MTRAKLKSPLLAGINRQELDDWLYGGNGGDGSMEYRQIRPEDAREYVEMMRSLDLETDMMMLEPGERKNDPEAAAAMIRESLAAGDFFLIAREGESMAGVLTAERGRCRRIRHAAYVVVGIRAGYRGRGIGTEMFKRLDAWAVSQEITRLELTVRKENKAAVHLYEKSGFVIEGLRKNSMRVGGAYADEYYMAKFIPRNEGA